VLLKSSRSFIGGQLDNITVKIPNPELKLNQVITDGLKTHQPSFQTTTQTHYAAARPHMTSKSTICPETM
jgi:hypothetical protein